MQLDLSYLEGVSGGDQNFIKEILQMFIDHTLPECASLRELIDKKDWPKVASTAHKMKSSISMLGNPLLNEQILFIEHSARNEKEVQLLPEKFVEIEDGLMKMGEKVKAYILKH